MSTITLNWKLYQVLGTDYYYAFYDDKIWCVKAEFVINGSIPESDTDAIFQVTVNKMEPKTRDRLLERMINLFPELELKQIRKSLQYTSTSL